MKTCGGALGPAHTVVMVRDVPGRDEAWLEALTALRPRPVAKNASRISSICQPSCGPI